MAVSHQLTSLVAGIGKPKAINDVVQSSFQQGKEDLSRDPFLAIRLGKDVSELVFQNAVDPFDLLLFAQLRAVFRHFLPRLTMLARRITPPVYGAFFRVTPLAFQKEFQVLSPTKPTNRCSISGQRKPPGLNFLKRVDRVDFAWDGQKELPKASHLESSDLNTAKTGQRLTPFSVSAGGIRYGEWGLHP
jgi:hypothetical protein